jgi:cytochrome c oxidase assembly factor CtaG
MLQAAFSSWTWNFWLIVIVALTALIYIRGWLRLHKHLPIRFPKWRLFSFLSGLFLLLIAIISPLDAFPECF